MACCRLYRAAREKSPKVLLRLLTAKKNNGVDRLNLLKERREKFRLMKRLLKNSDT